MNKLDIYPVDYVTAMKNEPSITMSCNMDNLSLLTQYYVCEIPFV